MIVVKMLHTINRALKKLDDFKKRHVVYEITTITPTEKQKRWASFAGDLALKVIFEENEGDYGGYLQAGYDNTIEHINVFLEEDGLILYLPKKGRFGVSKHEVSNEQLAELVREICCDLEEALYRIRETVSNIHNDDNLLAIKLCLLLGADWHSMGQLNSRTLADVITGRERFIPDYGKNLFTQEERETFFPKGGVIDITDKEFLDFLLLRVEFSINAIPVCAKGCYSNEEAHRSKWRLPSIHSHRKTPLSETEIGDFYGTGRLVGVAEEDCEGMLLTLLATTRERGLFLNQVLDARNMNLIEGIDTNLSIMAKELKKSFLTLSSKVLQKPNQSSRQSLRVTWGLHQGALGQEEIF